MGTVSPGLEFWRANADGEGEAITLKGMHDARGG